MSNLSDTHVNYNQPYQRNLHSVDDSEALPPFRPSLDQREAARTNVHQQSIQVPSARCKGYWMCTDTALEAMIEQCCPGLSKLSPELAFQQLYNTTHLFFLNPTETSSTGLKQHHKVIINNVNGIIANNALFSANERSEGEGKGKEEEGKGRERKGKTKSSSTSKFYQQSIVLYGYYHGFCCLP